MLRGTVGRPLKTISSSPRRWRRCNSSQAKLDSKAFAKTLQLPSTPFPLWANPEDVEGKYRDITCERLYNWQWENGKGRPLFVFHDGPPYANGDLHMGHALNKVLKDMINRFHLLQGKRVHYIPGWDCHGLPIESKTLKDNNLDFTSLTPSDLRKACHSTASREIANQKAQFQSLGIMADMSSPRRTYRTLDHEYEMRQLRIFERMVRNGLIYRHYRPVHYSPSSRSALAEAELVYVDKHVSFSVYVTFDLVSSGKSGVLEECMRRSEGRVKLLVWTTTPWTLTANMGIAINPELTYTAIQLPCGTIQIVAHDLIPQLIENEILSENPTVVAELKGSHFLGTTYKPIFSTDTEPKRIIPSTHVTSESGTGLVHCAPAHGTEDYTLFRSLGLISNTRNMLCHVGAKGEFTDRVAEVVGAEAAGRLVGKSVLGEGSKEAVELIKEAGRLVKVKKIKHRYPYDWKTNEPIILTATSQWFANLDNIKEHALEALQDVSFIPPISRNRLESFIKDRSEWCISRQRVWGVPIPAIYDIASDNALLDPESLAHILGVIQEKGTDAWWCEGVEVFLTPERLEELEKKGLRAEEVYRMGRDTMDVWFDSGSSWSMLPELGVGRTTPATAGENDPVEATAVEAGEGQTRKFHADVCLEGSDQHRGWFQSQLLTSVGAAAPGKGERALSPYGMLITHGMVLDEKGRKMSKSLGNIVSPLKIIYGGKDKKKEPAYGPDVLRLWAATVEYWRDMSIGPTILGQSAESYRKIRNSARFCLGNMDGVAGRPLLERVEREDMDLIERYIMHELYTLEQTALEGYSTYNFAKVANALNHFTNITLSSFYFDITKDCLYADPTDGKARRGVVTVLNHILQSLTKIIAPITPHLAEEIHATWKGNDGTSAFMTPWTPLGSEWADETAAKQVEELMQLRSSVLALLEQARMKKHIRSSLEAAVDIILPATDSAADEAWVQLLQEQGGVDMLKTLFIVSDVTIVKEEAHAASSEWEFKGTSKLPAPSGPVELALRVRAAPLSKCPRCWTYTREEDETLCGRCAKALPH